jgi:hypothetical protein
MAGAFADSATAYRHGYDLIDINVVWADLNGYLRDVQRVLSTELALLNFSHEQDDNRQS